MKQPAYSYKKKTDDISRVNIFSFCNRKNEQLQQQLYCSEIRKTFLPDSHTLSLLPSLSHMLILLFPLQHLKKVYANFKMVDFGNNNKKKTNEKIKQNKNKKQTCCLCTCVCVWACAAEYVLRIFFYFLFCCVFNCRRMNIVLFYKKTYEVCACILNKKKKRIWIGILFMLYNQPTNHPTN